jgi:hypothetical protein
LKAVTTVDDDLRASGTRYSCGPPLLGAVYWYELGDVAGQNEQTESIITADEKFGGDMRPRRLPLESPSCAGRRLFPLKSEPYLEATMLAVHDRKDCSNFSGEVVSAIV